MSHDKKDFETLRSFRHSDNPLPPPPKSTILAGTRISTSSINNHTNGASIANLGSSSFPPPPKLSISNYSNSLNATPSMTSSSIQKSSCPSPPKLNPSEGEHISGAYGNFWNERSSNIDDEGFVSQTVENNLEEPTMKNQKSSTHIETFHSTTEEIPPLSSAPASGSHNIGNVISAASAISSGVSWPSWSESGMGLLEKASQLAYTTIGTAADLATEYIVEGTLQPCDSIDDNKSQSESDKDGGRGRLAISFAGSSSHETDREKVILSFGSPDNCSRPSFTESPQNLLLQQQQYVFGHYEAAIPGVNQGNHSVPLTLPHQLHANMSSPSFTCDDFSVSVPDNSFKAVSKPETTVRAFSRPVLSTLALRQSRLKVLVLPTAVAQTIAAKNNTTLPEMFRVFGNSITGSKNQSDSFEPPLPPFRSAHRSMMLQWEHLILDFVSSQDMESSPVSEVVAERVLHESAHVWDEDCCSVSAENDSEISKLEKEVTNVLMNVEEEAKIMNAHGIPSMSSLPPSLSFLAPQKQHDVSEQHNDTSDFHSKQNQKLNASADAAFSLTSLPTDSWLLRFRHALDSSTNGMSHEMLCNPSVVILVASTSENYLLCFAELANVHHLPRPYHDGRYDPNGLRREFLLLHDVVDGPKNFDENRALAQMKERFGSGCCSVLRINSILIKSDFLNDVMEDPVWETTGPSLPFAGNNISPRYSPSIRNTEKPPARGKCLSVSDKLAIRHYVANMVATGLVPAIERRIANLNAVVTNAKRGMKNVIKSFWRKPKDSLLLNVQGYPDSRKEISNYSEHSASGCIKYRYDSIESQTRLLADTLFLMRDFDAALGVYRLVKDDYKHDKAMLYYASVQEMMVLCMYMLDPYGRDGRFVSDIQHSIETALYSYIKAAEEERAVESSSGMRPGEAPHATRLSSRLCLVLSSTQSLCEGRHMEIADLLASASSHETPLGAAVLLEQSSAQYYRAGMLRKYAFHMLMAGHMFRSAGQERHAFRCFAASLCVYHGERWEELRTHLCSALAAQLYGMDRFALSLQFYSKLVRGGGGRVSARSQQKFLNHIADICKYHQSSALSAIDRISISRDELDVSEKTELIDRILKGFTNAARNIEISNLGYPRVNDSTICIRAENACYSCTSISRADSFLTNTSTFSEGDEILWQNMMNCAEAELHASALSSTPEVTENVANEGVLISPLLFSGDEAIDRVIIELEKEERESELRERQKRKDKVNVPEIRATYEPLSVSFTLSNTLSLDVDLTEMQLVASLQSRSIGLQQTNAFPVSYCESDSLKYEVVKFYGSDKEYQKPEFLCQLPTLSKDSEIVIEPMKKCDPFFVVTKVTKKVTANSECSVSLNICPLVEGDFRVIGIRFKLLGDVWIFHRFNLPGPLLQDTRLNKSKRVRGESLMLQSLVEQKMPFLKVSVSPDPSIHETLLQGQTSFWMLKLTNLGYAPASNIMLKLDSPWLNINNSGETKLQSEDAPSSFCVGPSGTLMKVPFKSALGHLGILQPGETTEVPVVIRTSGGGRQEFQMLFRYERFESNGSKGTEPRCRWARELFSIPVYPSITMSASLMPSYSSKGEHILSIELMNYRSDQDLKLEVNLENICVASRKFSVQQFQGQIEAENGQEQSTLKIDWQERVTLHYFLVPIEKEAVVSALSMLPFSNENNFLLKVNHFRSQLTDFICRERAHEAFASALHTYRIEKAKLLAEQEKKGQPRHVSQIRRAKTSPSTDEAEVSTATVRQHASANLSHPTSITSLCPLDGSPIINIICCWSALVGHNDHSNRVHGQHHLRNILVRPQNKSKGCPLSLTAKHRGKLFHNFDLGPLDVDLLISVRNRLSKADVDFEFSVDHQSGFDFVGITSFTYKLSGGNEITVPLKARIFSSGVYNLQSVCLKVLKSNETIPYVFPLQWTVLIGDT